MSMGEWGSKKQIDGTGLCRQKQAALQRAKHVLGTTNLQTMNEIIMRPNPGSKENPGDLDEPEEHQDLC